MTSAEATALGALQGATEFLPISSSGHLRLAEAALGATPASVLFDIALHLGTLVAVVVVFRRDIVALLAGLLPSGEQTWRRQPAVRAVGLLVLASLPTALIGLALESLVSQHIEITWVGALLIVNGLVLFTTRKATPGAGESDSPADWGIGPGQALIIGVAQGLGVLPGISRSGATIAAALHCGVAWRPAAVFSFLLSIPAILGALLLKIDEVGAFAGQQAAVAIGVITAVVVGIVSLALLLVVLRSARFHSFGWYCLIVGAAATTWGLTG